MNKDERTDLIGELKESQIEFLENENMSSYSSIKIGGRADLIIFPKNERDLLFIANLLKIHMRNYYIIGRGTNTLFKDDRICPPVISFKKFNANFPEHEINGSEIVLKAGAGMPLSRILNYAIKNNMGGCEFFYGIPGTLGGAVRMNAGSKESVIGNIIEKIEIITDGGAKLTVEKNDMEFLYRNLKIKNMEDNYFIAGVHLKLYKSSEPAIMENIEIFKKRKSSQPLGEFSLGCIFKNPADESAGKIIEDMGFKGFSNGGVSVSKKHANFIINRGAAKPGDITSLIRIIQEKVLLHKGVKLNTEIKII